MYILAEINNWPEAFAYAAVAAAFAFVLWALIKYTSQ